MARVFLAAALSHTDASGMREFAYENRNLDLALDFCAASVFVGDGGLGAWLQRQMAETKAEWERAANEDAAFWATEAGEAAPEPANWGEWTELDRSEHARPGFRVWSLGDEEDGGLFVCREVEADEA